MTMWFYHAINVNHFMQYEWQYLEFTLAVWASFKLRQLGLTNQIVFNSNLDSNNFISQIMSNSKSDDKLGL